MMQDLPTVFNVELTGVPLWMFSGKAIEINLGIAGFNGKHPKSICF